jgi:hypothetical protein
MQLINNLEVPMRYSPLLPHIVAAAATKKIMTLIDNDVLPTITHEMVSIETLYSYAILYKPGTTWVQAWVEI